MIWIVVIIVIAVVILAAISIARAGSRLEETVPFRDLIERQARAHGIDPCLLAAVVKVESNFRPDAVRQEPRINDASYGLGQVLLSTARDFEDVSAQDLLDPETNLRIASKVLRWLRQNGVPLPDGVDAYNMGIGAFRRGRRNLTYRQRVLEAMTQVCKGA